jgi:outer membrane protein assembly factor BamB
MDGGNLQHTGRSNIVGPTGPYVSAKWSITPSSAASSSPVIDKYGALYIGTCDAGVHAYNSSTGAYLRQISISPSSAGFVITAAGCLIMASTGGQVKSINTTTGSTVWTATLGSGTDSSPAVGPDGTVYIGCSDSYVYALNGTTGAQNWRYVTFSSISSSPAIDNNGVVYITSSGGRTYAINANGTRRWTFFPANGMTSGVSIGSDGTVYVGGDMGVYALRSNGTKQWFYNIGDTMSVPPALGLNGLLYASCTNWNVYALNMSSGLLAWMVELFGEPASQPLIGADGTVYVSVSDGTLYAFNGNTGAALWHFDTGSVLLYQPVMTQEGALIISTQLNKIYAVKAAAPPPVPINAGLQSGAPWPMFGGDVQHTGRSSLVGPLGPAVAANWTFNCTGTFVGSPAVDKNGIVYIGCDPLNAYAINGTSGAVKFQLSSVKATNTFLISSMDLLIAAFVGQVSAYNLTTRHWVWNSLPFDANAVCSSSVIGPDGILYIPCDDGYLYAINSTTGTQKWQAAASDAFYGAPSYGGNGVIYVVATGNNLYAMNATTGFVQWRYTVGSLVVAAPVVGQNGDIYIGAGDGTIHAVAETGSLTLVFCDWRCSERDSGTRRGRNRVCRVVRPVSVRHLSQRNTPVDVYWCESLRECPCGRRWIHIRG